MNVRQNVFLTLKKKKLKFFEICFLSFRPCVTVSAGCRVRSNLSRLIYIATTCRDLASKPHNSDTVYLVFFLPLSLSPAVALLQE